MGTTAQQTDREWALAELHKIVKPGTTLHTILRHASASGMNRSISVIKVGRDGRIWTLDYLLVHAGIGGKLDERHGGVRVPGGGMDMGFALVYNLSSRLYGTSRGYACLGDRCPSNSHVNDPNAPRGRGVRHHDGYAVSQRWL